MSVPSTVERGEPRCEAPAPTDSPQPAVFDLADYDTSTAVALDDGRVQVELNQAVAIVGTVAELHNLGATITSHATAMALELAR